jgi:hypothetical protein
MRLQYYRVFLERTKQLSLLDDTETTKQDLLYEAFNQRTPVHFTNAKQQLAFVTHTESDTYIYASLAKSTQVSIQHAPEEGFVVEEVTSWPKVPILINTDNDPQTGQTVAIGINQQIFDQPLIQLRKLASELNKRVFKNRGYEMIINPISISNDFWGVVSDYKGKIKALKFSYASPNLFNTNDSLNDELKHARDIFKATNSAVELENGEGGLELPEDDPYIKQSVDYVAQGGGDYRIKLTSRRVITSEDSVATKEVEELELDISTKTKSTFKTMCDTLFLWLKNLE